MTMAAMTEEVPETQHKLEEYYDSDFSYNSDSEIDDDDWIDWLDTWLHGDNHHHHSQCSILKPLSTAVRAIVRDMAIVKTTTTDKQEDQTTVQQAIDPRTCMVLLNRGVFADINGCISTGKEANVYHATKSNGQELAIKIYKTSEPRKMVKTRAEKEMRNLIRLKAEGIRCPTPHDLRLPVLVMEFIGNDGWTATRLKDADLTLDKLREGYVEIIVAMRTMYQKCKLVHGDLSENNIHYYEGHMYIIDVSQAVDLDHPHVHCLLIQDCIHVTAFFEKHCVGVMTIEELFKFIVKADIADDAEDSYLEEVQKQILARGYASVETDIEALYEEVQRSEKDTSDLYDQTIIGLKDALTREKLSLQNDQQKKKSKTKKDSQVISDGTNLLEGDADSQPGEDEEDNESDSEEVSSFESDSDTPAEKKAARKEVRKENKKKVKEEKREARKYKVPKAVKKRKKKMSKAPKAR